MSNEYLSFEDFQKMDLSVLEKAGIDYMIGGAVAVWPRGDPRSTQDIDIVSYGESSQYSAPLFFHQGAELMVI